MEYISEATFGPTTSGSASKKGTALPLSPAAVGAISAAADFIAIIAASVVSGTAYHHMFIGGYGNTSVFLGAGLIIALAFVTSFHASKGYDIQNIRARRNVVLHILALWGASFALLTILVFLMKLGHTLSRGHVLTFFAFGGGVILTVHHSVRLMFSRSLRQHAPKGPRAVLIADMSSIGNSHTMSSLQRRGYNFDGIFELPKLSDDARFDERRGELEKIRAHVRNSDIEEVMILADWDQLGKISPLLDALRVIPLPVRLVADHRYGDLLSRPMAKIGGTVAVEIHRAPLNRLERTMKRVLDLALASAGLIALLPLFLMVAIAIKLDSPGPVFFRQSRVGFSGRVFRIYKFRSMTTMDDGTVVKQAVKGDNRVTRIGKFLRASSIDELPQLLNVLNGDMSLVGPRPHALAHDTMYDEIIHDYAFRHHMKPGITGWAQVSGFRGETPTVDLMERRVEYDLAYINNWTLMFDIKIIFLTALRSLKQGAY
ncbi:undecaprenyl-phosphate glucose phosphotransferase [Agaricicola taiwanensis]|uniref:Undecaprenyl-phosphate glucose phosphotransferase n=1 Tax=Agaricicola taiwanensis TaxID=591372 RepID=A0A8J3DXQ5_9RHOB|nr:undecaprenyl-phosphate glucose phosphotransferase [Agaricicola taiwanensis]GGE48725.1 undecaprenyl-phosphate glucose phosphotransferase [Agaricicola taiwanensis]